MCNVIRNNQQIGSKIRDVGVKAFRLMELSWWSHDRGAFKVPQFCVLPAALSRQYYQENGPAPGVVFQGLPDPSRIPLALSEFFDGFYERFTDSFAQCIDGMNSAQLVYVGSSIDLGDECSLSYAGLNSRSAPSSPRISEHFMKTAVENALAGLFRPYAEWYLNGHGLASRERCAGIMFYEYIEAAFEAVAHIVDDRVLVECKRLRDEGKRDWSDIHFSLTSQSDWEGYWSDNGRGDRVKKALLELLATARVQKGQLVEVEFCFDASDDLYVLQYRAYSAYRSQGRPSVFGTVGSVSGMVTSLLDSEVSDWQAERVGSLLTSSRPGPIWLVHRHGDEWDGFKLLWQVSEVCRSSQPVRLVLCHSADRQPMHLTTALREDHRVEFFGEIDINRASQIPDGSEATLHCDGMRVWWDSPESTAPPALF